MKRIEFHVHTKASKDSLLGAHLLLARCRVRGIDAIAITDHNEVSFALKYKEYFKKHGVEIIPGEEIFTKEGEIIGLYLKERIKPGLSPEDTIAEIRRQGGLVYVPHPYDVKRAKTVLRPEALARIASQVDLIEKHNVRNIETGYSIKQNAIAEKYGLRKVVGSDAHTFYEVGRNYCLVESVSRPDLLRELSEAVFVEARCIKFAHTNTKLVKLLKMLGKGDFNGIVGTVKRKLKRGK